MDYAGVAHRFVALLIDGVLFFALGLFMGLATGGGYSTRSGGTHEFGVQAGTLQAAPTSTAKRLAPTSIATTISPRLVRMDMKRSCDVSITPNTSSTSVPPT